MRGVRQAAIVLGTTAFIVLCSISAASAARFSSSSYVIDASVVGNSMGGSQSSSSYKLTGAGGESIVGNGAGGSYKVGIGYVAQLPKSLQLTVQPSGLVAYYPLDEGAGAVAYDASAYGNNGTVTTPPGGWTPSGKVGGAYTYSTGGSDIRVPDNSQLPTGRTMTISLWAYGANAANRALMSQWDYSGGTPTSGAWALQTGNTDGTQLRFLVANTLTDSGNNFVTTPTGSWTTGWHHVTVTFDGNQAAPIERVKIYIDGAQQTLTMGGTIAQDILDANAFLCIGDFYGLIRPFGNPEDEIKLYNRTLSPNEVLAEYTAGSAGNTAGLSFATDIIPGASQTSNFDAVVLTDASNYSLAINQNQNLTKGADTIPAISSTTASPSSWSEGTTKGLGFTLYGSNATAIDSKWSAGNSYAAFPGVATTIYTRANRQTNKDILNMRLRLDVDSTQPLGDYTNVITMTGTILP